MRIAVPCSCFLFSSSSSFCSSPASGACEGLGYAQAVVQLGCSANVSRATGYHTKLVSGQCSSAPLQSIYQNALPGQALTQEATHLPPGYRLLFGMVILMLLMLGCMRRRDTIIYMNKEAAQPTKL